MTAAAPRADDGVASRVLVVDDEPHLLRALSMNLSGRGYRVSTATTGGAALDAIAASRPDLLVLDLGLPDMDGLEVIRRVRDRDAVLPILVLSARSTSQEKVSALDLGANDFVTKPFDMNELVARLRAAARRTEHDESDVVVFGSVHVDLGARSVRRVGASSTADGDEIRLTRTEWRVLDALLRRPGALTTADDLLVAMRGDPERSYLRIYMQQLRRKLEDVPSRPRHLITEPGLGYRFVP